MNILVLTHQGNIAGSTYSIDYLCRGLAAKGHKVVVGCRKESLLFQSLENSDVIRQPMTFKSRLDLSNMKMIAQTVKKHNIQIINAQSSKDRYTSVLAKWLYRLQVKVVHTRRQIAESIGGFLQNLIYYRGTDKIIAVSEGVKASLVGKGIPASHIEVIYNGTPKNKYKNINPETVTRLKKNFQIEKGDFVIGCVSRKKKQEQILQALTLIEFPVKVLFVGIAQQTEYKTILSSLPEQHKIYFTGLLGPSEVLNYYKLFDCKVLASTMEGLSQSLLEAMALEVPVIATHAAGNPELVKNGQNGFTFEDGNINDLANKIRILHENIDIRRKFIVNGTKTVFKEFSIENTINNYQIFFEELIANR